MSFAVAAGDARNLRPGLFGFGRSVDADHRTWIVTLRKTGDHAGLGPTGHRTDDDVVEYDPEFRLLLLDFLGPPGEAQAAEGMVRRTRRNGVGLAATIFNVENRPLPTLLESDSETRFARDGRRRPSAD